MVAQVESCVNGDLQQQHGAAPDPEYIDSGMQKNSRVLIPAARVITLKPGMRPWESPSARSSYSADLNTRSASIVQI